MCPPYLQSLATIQTMDWKRRSGPPYEPCGSRSTFAVVLSFFLLTYFLSWQHQNSRPAYATAHCLSVCLSVCLRQCMLCLSCSLSDDVCQPSVQYMIALLSTHKRYSFHVMENTRERLTETRSYLCLVPPGRHPSQRRLEPLVRP